MPARDHEPVALGQAVEGREQRLAPLASQERRLGGRDRVLLAALLGHAQREPLPPAGGDHPVAGLVGDDLEQPGPKRRARPEAPQRPCALTNALLGGVLGLRGGVRDARRVRNAIVWCILTSSS